MDLSGGDLDAADQRFEDLDVTSQDRFESFYYRAPIAVEKGDPEAARRALGVLPDARGVYKRLTARENIRYFGELHGMAPALIAERTARLAAALQMEDFLDRQTDGFSQGHNVIGAGCMPKLFGQFIATTDAKALDAKCLDHLAYVQPFTSFNGWEP